MDDVSLSSVQTWLDATVRELPFSQDLNMEQSMDKLRECKVILTAFPPKMRTCGPSRLIELQQELNDLSILLDRVKTFNLTLLRLDADSQVLSEVKFDPSSRMHLRT